VSTSRGEKGSLRRAHAAQGGVVPTKPPPPSARPTTAPGSTKSRVCCAEQPLQVQRRRRVRAGPGPVHARLEAAGRPALRHLVGDYDTYAIPNSAAGPETTTSYRMKVSEWSKRIGPAVPAERTDVVPLLGRHLVQHLGRCLFAQRGQRRHPARAGDQRRARRQARLGRRQFTPRRAFRSTKLHERNTDPLVNLVTLSGKRHVAGFELDLAGPHHAAGLGGVCLVHVDAGGQDRRSAWPAPKAKAPAPALTPGTRARCGPPTAHAAVRVGAA
jgi:catecholate siderophore receptor